MILEEQSDESSSQSVSLEMDVNLPPAHQNADSDDSNVHMDVSKNDEYFIGKVIHPFDAQADEELSRSIDDYVVVRQFVKIVLLILFYICFCIISFKKL
ncbi:hypothetical protein Dsin_023341 [Dipteronia sinensis]|uniref:Uncharacterized protein n=1 Tax=Dipteronia sinensis TaxID=43782 RepID=A0AAE0A4R1_9ROSI|nr:hypothetical protein Dsin_023341 [Dipteronia sinensis]